MPTSSRDSIVKALHQIAYQRQREITAHQTFLLLQKRGETLAQGKEIFSNRISIPIVCPLPSATADKKHVRFRTEVFDNSWRTKNVEVISSDNPRQGYTVEQLHYDDPDQDKNIDSARYEPSYINFFREDSS